MKKIVLAVVVAVMPGWVAAEQSKPQPKKAQNSGTPAKACPEYGPGFVRVAGSGSCVKVGGTLRIESGGTR